VPRSKYAGNVEILNVSYLSTIFVNKFVACFPELAYTGIAFFSQRL
jgi:hypothetical protein